MRIGLNSSHGFRRAFTFAAYKKQETLVPPKVRIQRLKDRKLARYGSALAEDTLRKEKYHQFIAWASGYDDNSTQGRNLSKHLDWLRRSLVKRWRYMVIHPSGKECD